VNISFMHVCVQYEKKMKYGIDFILGKLSTFISRSNRINENEKSPIQRCLPEFFFLSFLFFLYQFEYFELAREEIS
jgi:hypothetical protein